MKSDVCVFAGVDALSLREAEVVGLSPTWGANFPYSPRQSVTRLLSKPLGFKVSPPGQIRSARAYRRALSSARTLQRQEI